MRPIGGELELKKPYGSMYFTDSGRSSLKLFIRSGNSEKKILLPDFFCGVIEDVLLGENVEYDFYHVSNDLTIDKDTVQGKEYDVFYVINYFGIVHDLSLLELDDKIIIEDNVFLNDFDNSKNYNNWFGFNSFRKISSLSDGSMIRTNLSVKESLIECHDASFVTEKQSAKNAKYEYIENNTGSEEGYLSLFDGAESKLNDQTQIFKMSNASLFNMSKLNSDSNQKIAKQRYEFMCSEFNNFCTDKIPDYYSFFPMRVKNRNNLKSNLSDAGIYLPVHWPYSTMPNSLYEDIISVPLFAEYSDKDFLYLFSNLKKAVG